MPRSDGGKAQPEEQSVRESPPGQFVSNQHADDCSRFLQEVKEFIRRRTEAGLARQR